MSSSYRLELDRWLSQLNVNAKKLLDIGGSQLPVKGRTKSWDVEEYLIADLPQPHADSPKPDIEIDMNSLIDKGDYDLIFCLEVFDYVYDPLTAMLNINGLLANGGRAWVTFPSFYPLHQPVEDDALRFMPGGIVKLAKAAELSIEQMIMRRPETDLLDRFYRAERMRAAKHEDHNFTGYICEFSKV